ncbi:MAG: transposase [Candidatus Omnitrophica bacterium]|nr:transposase [Candidatus Omnitrophota bacterium]
MTKTRLYIPNACYHIYGRGNQKQRIFFDNSDFEFYLTQLKRYKKRYFFRIYGYCLMPNHIHLLGEPKEPKNLSTMMQCLHRSYTAYFNNKYKKVGHLWQDRFRSKVIIRDDYLLRCISYIEQNPIRANLVENLEDYKFTSFIERCLSNTPNKPLLDQLNI